MLSVSGNDTDPRNVLIDQIFLDDWRNGWFGANFNDEELKLGPKLRDALAFSYAEQQEIDEDNAGIMMSAPFEGSPLEQPDQHQKRTPVGERAARRKGSHGSVPTFGGTALSEVHETRRSRQPHRSAYADICASNLEFHGDRHERRP